MKLCFPIEKDEGLDSAVFGHFGSAPAFMVLDTVAREGKTLTGNPHHPHGMCSPLAAISGEGVDVVITGGIGAGAISGLKAAGIEVYKAVNGTVKENMDAFELGGLAKLESGHCSGHGCAH